MDIMDCHGRFNMGCSSSLPAVDYSYIAAKHNSAILAYSMPLYMIAKKTIKPNLLNFTTVTGILKSKTALLGYRRECYKDALTPLKNCLYPEISAYDSDS